MLTLLLYYIGASAFTLATAAAAINANFKYYFSVSAKYCALNTTAAADVFTATKNYAMHQFPLQVPCCNY
jgi:hypothetical protein